MTLRNWLSIGLSLLLLNGIVFYYYQNTVKKTGAGYVYPLDDTYIHLSVAKNAALYNEWGITRHEFSSTSSAPLYTFMLSVLIKLFGNNALYPLFVNIVFGNLIVIAIGMFLKRNGLFMVLTLFLFTPILLHIQIVSGMEHTLHIFLIMLVFMLLSRLIESGFKTKKHVFLFLAVTVLLCLTRYESMFFVFCIAIVLMFHRQYRLSLGTVAFAFLPVLLFGIWSMQKGGFFFPNSLLVKGDIAFSDGIPRMLRHYIGKIYHNIFNVPIFIVPIAILIGIAVQDFVYSKQYNLRGFISLIKKHSLVFITLVTILLHGLFANFGWLYRYEAYLLLLLYANIVVLAGKNSSLFTQTRKIVLTLSISIIFISSTMFSFVFRLAGAHKTILSAGKNIHDQQIQMGKFLHTYYDESMVMANDIGAITYYKEDLPKDVRITIFDEEAQ